MRPRLNYSNVMATAALFVALGGTSYAITRLPKDSVGSAQVRDGSLQLRDLAGSARRTGPRGPRGAQGPAGPVGAGGVQGSAGARGPSNVVSAAPGPNVVLPGVAYQFTEARRLPTLPAGSWDLRFLANANLATPQGMYAICRMLVNGDQVGINYLAVGNAPNAVQEGPVPIEVVLTRTAPFTVKTECGPDQNASGNPPITIVRPQMIATLIGELTDAP